MSAGVFALVLLAALLHAGWNALARGRMGAKGGVTAASNTTGGVNAASIGMGAGAMSLVVLPFTGLPDAASWPALGLSALIHILYFRLLVSVYREAELSVAYPLMRGLPPLAVAMIGMAVLSETPSLLGWVAILAMTAGVCLLAAEGLHSGAASGRGLSRVLANVAVIAAYTLVDGVGVRLSGNPAGYAACHFVMDAIALAPFGGVAALRALGANWRPQLPVVLLGGACTLGSYGIALWAMTRAPIAMVAAAREMSVVFAAILGALFLGERFGRLRWAAVALTAMGLAGIRHA